MKIYREQQPIKGLTELIKDSSQNEKEYHKVQGFCKIQVPLEFDYDVLHITIKSIAKEGKLLRVYATATKNEQPVFVDNPLYYDNPPILVPDGTFSRVVDRAGKLGDKPNFKEDLEEALRQIVGETIKITHQ